MTKKLIVGDTVMYKGIKSFVTNELILGALLDNHYRKNVNIVDIDFKLCNMILLEKAQSFWETYSNFNVANNIRYD